MRSYPFIDELFRNVLEKSTAIAGRSFICPKQGTEINSDELGQVIQDLVDPLRLTKKYPLAIWMPPTAYGQYRVQNNRLPAGEWERYVITGFFLTPAHYTAGDNKTLNPNKSTRTSTHTVMQTWHDMKRCAQNFITVLDKFTRSEGLVANSFRLDHQRDKIISPVSGIGVDNASGVRLDFGFELMIGCELEDYSENDIAGITVPVADSHPEHQL